jgi:hypothetical protein
MWYGARYKYWAWLFVAVFMLLVSRTSYAALTDIKFGQSQIADSQWNVNACLNTTTCQIYSKQPGTMYKIPWTSGQWSWQAGQYVQFVLTGNATNPYEGKVYNSNGTLAGTIGTGHIVNMGPDYFFFVGNDNNTGQLFSGSTGMSGTGGVTWTGTLNPTIAQADTYANATYSTTPLSAGQTATSTPNSSGPPPPSWQAIRTNSNPVVISNIYPTSYNSPGGEGATNAFDGNVNTKYLNFDKKNAGVTVRLSQGRVVQKFTVTTANDFSGRDPTSYKLYGSNDGVNWTLIKQDSLSLSENRYWTSPEITVSNTNAYVYYFMLFPTTKAGDGCGQNCNSMQIAEITYYYDANDGVTSTDLAAGSTPSNPGTPGSVCSDCYSSDITSTQLASLNAAKTRLGAVALGNRIDLYSDGSGNNVTIEQVGNWNKIQGLGGGDARVAGFGTTVDIKQGDYGSGKNLIELYAQGNGNSITISQARDTTTGAQDGQESGGHFLQLKVVGDINTVVMRQGNDGGGSSGHVAFLDVSGSFNNLTIKQANDNEKRFFGVINGNSNVLNVTQQNTGNHYLDVNLVGNSNNATINQKDSGSHKATISLTNAGGASNLTLIQQGATGQVYSIQQTCANAAGCSVSVTQQ